MNDIYRLTERLARGLPESVTVQDIGVPERPPGRYVVLYDDSGLARPTRLDADPRRVRWTTRALCVAATPAGLRDLVARVRHLLSGWRPDVTSTSRLVEQAAGPVLVDGPEGDERLSQTLIWSHYSNRSANDR